MFTFFGGVLMKSFTIKFLFFLVFILTLGLINQPITIQAAAPTKDEVFENAPAGLNLDGLIEDPDYENGTNDASLNKDFPVNIVEMLTKDGGQDQISSFWGKKYKDSDDTKLYNYFDLTKDQTISAWIYYGDVYHNYPAGSNIDKESTYTDGMNDNKTPDGLALVLQNDDRGAKAISTAIGGDKAGYPSYGETLGVWGGSTVDHSPLTSSVKSYGLIPSYPEDTVYNQKLQNGAIQNSFALELDALQNFKMPSTKITGINFEAIQGKDDYFDIANDYKGQHITSGYPGDAATYKDYATKGFTSAVFTNTKGYYFSQNYNSGTSNNIQMSGYYSSDSEDMNVNKAWKHLTFKYKKDGSFTYRYNDQELDGTAKPLNELSAGNGTIDTSKLGDSKYVRWGFTASTGSQYSAPNDVAIVMQQMPSTANVQSSVKLLDMSQYNSDGILGREISDLKNDPNYRDGMLSLFTNKNSYNVANNDKLLFKYGLTYDSGTLETGEINTTLDLPENVNFTPGVSGSVGDKSIGQLVYDDGTTQEILPSDITQNSDGSSSIKLKLKTMDTSGQKATIYLYGQAFATTTPKLVNGTPTTFNSQNYIENITTPSFIINDQLNLDATQLNQTIDSDKDATIKGTINYVNKSKFNGDDLTLHTKINGTQIDDTKYSTTSDTTTTDFSMIMTNALSDGSPLKIGKNTIEVYVTDSLKRVSNTVTYTITVNDYKDLILTTTSPDPMKVKITDPIQLDSKITYSNDDKITALSNLTGYLKIDDNKFEKINIDSNSNTDNITTLFIKMAAGKLDVGEHTLYFYVNDGTRDSNIVEYHITVTNKTLLLKANDDDTNQTVQNNSNVKLRGTYHYEDNSDFINEITSVKYQITNEDGTKQAVVTKEIQPDDSTAEFTLTLKPIGADLFDNPSEQTLTDYLKTATGLKVGKNEVSVTAYDGKDATSNTEAYTINVPTLDPKIESDSLTVDSIEQMKLPLSLKFTYSDADYQLQSKDLATFTQVKNSDNSTMTVLKKPDTSTTTPYQFNIKSNWNDDLVEGQNTVSVYAMDRYLRKSNVLDYQMNILPSGTQIEVGNYRFKTIDPKKGVADYVQRDGAWNIEINSYQDKWTLKAKASNMLRQDITGNYSELSDLSLVNKKTENEIGTDLISNPTIASGDSTGSALPISYMLFGNDSDANSGILLKTDGTPLGGEYQSTITWSIDDSI